MYFEVKIQILIKSQHISDAHGANRITHEVIVMIGS